jgi:hypothetical protein
MIADEKNLPARRPEGLAWPLRAAYRRISNGRDKGEAANKGYREKRVDDKEQNDC